MFPVFTKAFGRQYLPGNSLTFSGWLSDPFKWLSDLQLRDEKVAKNHLVLDFPLLH